MTAHGNCAHCEAICEPGFSTCSQECNLAHRAGSAKKEGLSEVPEGYWTLGELALKLGLSPATLYARKVSGKPFPKGICGHYSLEEVAALGIKPRAKRDEVEPVHEKVELVQPASVERSPEPQVVIVEGRSLEERKQALTEGIAQINRRLPEAIRESMIRAAHEAAKDACLMHADEARKRGDHWLRAQCLEDFVHLDECLKITFNEKEAR